MNATLVIGERPDRARALAQWLGLYGVDAVPCGREPELAANCLSSHEISSILLFVDETPESSQFFDTLRELTTAPILAMGAAEDLDSLVAYMDKGADDYIPGSMPVAAIAGKILGFTPPSLGPGVHDTPVISVGDLEIDLDAREVTLRGDSIALSPLEFKLLQVLAENAGRACGRRMLLNRVWGAEFEDHPEYLRVYMGYLRQKLEEEPRRPRLLRTEWGYGYRLVLPRKAARSGQPRPALRPVSST